MEGTETSVKCECGHYLTLVENATIDGKTYYKLVCKNCGITYVENDPLSGKWEKME